MSPAKVQRKAPLICVSQDAQFYDSQQLASQSATTAATKCKVNDVIKRYQGHVRSCSIAVKGCILYTVYSPVIKPYFRINIVKTIRVAWFSMRFQQHPPLKWSIHKSRCDWENIKKLGAILKINRQKLGLSKASHSMQQPEHLNVQVLRDSPLCCLCSQFFTKLHFK